MLDFELYTPTKIFFGRGRCDEVGKVVAAYGCRKPLISYGGGSARRSGLLGRVEASLRDAGLDFAELGGVRANPTVEFCAETASYAREQGCDMLLAVGGGSVIDNAKWPRTASGPDATPGTIQTTAPNQLKVCPLASS